MGLGEGEKEGRGREFKGSCEAMEAIFDILSICLFSILFFECPWWKANIRVWTSCYADGYTSAEFVCIVRSLVADVYA